MTTPNSLTKKRRVAVATSDGVQIDQHLGHATGFWIYDVEPTGAVEFVERRTSAGLARVDPHDWASVGALLEGVDLVLAAQAGPGASRLLAEHGVLALAITGPVERALVACGRRGWLLERGPARQAARPDECCGQHRRECS